VEILLEGLSNRPSTIREITGAGSRAAVSRCVTDSIASGKASLFQSEVKIGRSRGECGARQQFLGPAQQLPLFHVPGKGEGELFEGAAGDQFVETP